MCKYAERCGDRDPVTIPGHGALCSVDAIAVSLCAKLFTKVIWGLRHGMIFLHLSQKCMTSRFAINSCAQLATDLVLHCWGPTGQNSQLATVCRNVEIHFLTLSKPGFSWGTLCPPPPSWQNPVALLTIYSSKSFLKPYPKLSLLTKFGVHGNHS